MCLTDRKYPQKLAFLYLQQVADAFLAELQTQFGTGAVDHHSKIETIEKQYAFIKFGKF